MRFMALVTAVIFAIALTGCASQGQADTSTGTGSSDTTTLGTPGAQQTDMPGTDPGSTGASGAMTGTTGIDTGVTGSDTVTDTNGSSGADTSSTGTGGSGTSNTGGAGATGAMTDTTNAGDTSGGLSGSFGDWNYAMLDGFTTGSDAGASAAITMTGAFEGDSYVVELQRGDAGDATSLDEWVTAEMDALGGSEVITGTQSATVGNFNATTLTLPQAAFGGNFADATCAVRAYVWGMGSDDSSNSSGSDDSGSGSNDDSSGNLLIVTVYQTSGDICNANQVMTQFLSGFQSSDMSGSDSSSDNSGSAGTATGTTTP